MEMRPSLHDCKTVFGDLLIQNIVGLVVRRTDCVLRTDADASAAAYTFIMVNKGFPVCNLRRIMGTHPDTVAAPDTILDLNVRLACAVHFHLSRPGSASHANILKRASKSGRLMSFKMAQRNEYVGIHDGTSDLGISYIFSFYRYLYFIGSLQSIRDQDVASGREWRESILIRGIQMIQRILPATDIQRITVCKKWPAT